MAEQTRDKGMLAEVHTAHEVRIKPAEFDKITRFAKDHFGLDLKSGKEELVTARLSRKIRQGHYRSFGDYFEAVMADPSGSGLLELIDALTTNHTSFLREAAHFDFLTKLLATELAKVPVIRIWSAACSTGEEPYTIVACLLAAGRQLTGFELKATDISTRVLAQAQRAVYRQDAIASLPDAWRRACFLRGHGRTAGWCRVRPNIIERIRFERFNLVENGPVEGRYHVIFCRNVMIYFDKPTQQHVVGRLASALEPGGYLMVGHSESLAGVEHGLTYVQPATYRKDGAATRRRT